MFYILREFQKVPVFCTEIGSNGVFESFNIF